MIVKQLRSIVILVVSLLAVFLLAACEQPAAPEVAADNSVSEDKAEMVTELQIIDVEAGEGATASAGQMVVVHYTGWLYEPGAEENKGAKFDSSRDRDDPFMFPLGQGQVIQGWDQGFAGMQVGGKRTLIIPPHMGYGERGAGAVIPPGATLLFDVELLDVQ
ncbi:MAG: FKBP-type peptidyl-prolyl cis-trans isomerase [Gammaproteobacteria bacterium]|nr:FKBP-type peptidyl-prolyl cis-trans isomerase [Gammaproteobacteria bacterium]MCP4091600.1 FKBP-type peptidyl-prolyl cis-trans isomerase [Gammaproteobacteria bacterium]MCP4276096.1 FKBP-type peptidyl-prolyl cis-trans isomerase [Gammaproteobacteria bacterium]MCP4830840.1 FKBP-type peptidyl-prolyl cis-trans isomerase [Gammaproteobacteria bacterium]MCP4929666.1 FKBP-type peptidyl-prolyl cis-trans isomerase [Gammaproteobacteria bacterium]